MAAERKQRVHSKGIPLGQVKDESTKNRIGFSGVTTKWLRQHLRMWRLGRKMKGKIRLTQAWATEWSEIRHMKT